MYSVLCNIQQILEGENRSTTEPKSTTLSAQQTKQNKYLSFQSAGWKSSVLDTFPLNMIFKCSIGVFMIVSHSLRLFASFINIESVQVPKPRTPILFPLDSSLKSTS